MAPPESGGARSVNNLGYAERLITSADGPDGSIDAARERILEE